MENPIPKVGDKVWVACRATEGCEGKYSEIMFIRKQGQDISYANSTPALGGHLIRYKCCTCGKPFPVVT